MRRLDFTAAVLIVMAAGCIGDAGPDQGPVNPVLSPDDGTRFLRPLHSIRMGTPVRLGFVDGGAEPSVATARDGTIYAGATFGQIFRSEDEGRTWVRLGSASCSGVSPVCPMTTQGDAGPDAGADADIAVSGTGRLHFLGLLCGAACDDEARIVFAYSDDRGDTWSEPVDLADALPKGPLVALDRPWLVGSSDTQQVYATVRHVGSGLMLRDSDDEGETWRDAMRISDDGTAGPLVVAGPGSPMFVPVEGDDLEVSRFESQRNAWQRHDVPDYQPGSDVAFPVGGLKPDGTMIVAWAEDPMRDPTSTPAALLEPEVFLSESHDDGASWSEPLRVSPEGHTAIFPWLSLRPDGAAFLAWYGKESGGPVGSPEGAWRPYLATLDESGQLVAAPAPMTAAPTHLGPVCVDPVTCLSSCAAACVHTGERTLLDFFKVGITFDGRPVVAFAADAASPALRRQGADIWVTVGEA